MDQSCVGSEIGPEEIHCLDLKHRRDLFEHVDSRGVAFTLEEANVVSVDPGTVGKLLLRQAPGMSNAAQILGDDLP